MTDDLGTPEGSGGSTALLSFIAQNVRSYRDEVVFLLEATRLANREVVHRLAIAGIKDPVKVLPAAGIFGANASGKSQLLHAMSDMRSIVINSFRRGDRTSGIRRRPFLLDEKTRHQPSRFEIDLILDGVRWQYGFEVDDERALGEYAYHYPNGRQALVFDRDLYEVRFGTSFRTAGRALIPLLRDNALLLSVAGAVDTKDIGPLYEWFLKNMRLIDLRSRESRVSFTANLVNSAEMRHRILKLLRAADLGIVDIKIEEISPDPETQDRIRRIFAIIKEELKDNLESEDSEKEIDLEQITSTDLVNFVHEGVDGNVELDFEDESAGTMAWLGMIGPVLEVLEDGGALLVDELGASFHPYLVERLIELFQNIRTNPRCAQLIFNSHDMTILRRTNRHPLGRDQIWFTEKERNGLSTLYPLFEFKTRIDESIDLRYLEGRFGGVAHLIPGEFIEAVEPVSSSVVHETI